MIRTEYERNTYGDRFSKIEKIRTNTYEYKRNTYGIRTNTDTIRTNTYAIRTEYVRIRLCTYYFFGCTYHVRIAFVFVKKIRTDTNGQFSIRTSKYVQKYVRIRTIRTQPYSYVFCMKIRTNTYMRVD